MVKIAVIGSRGFSNYTLFCEKLEYLIQNLSVDYFVSGGAKSGGDALIKIYCNEKGLKLIEFLPDYEKYSSKVAPIKRNQQIIDEATHVIAFWDFESKGTKDSLTKAEKEVYR